MSRPLLKGVIAVCETCPTVDIDRDGVQVTINESDLKPTDKIYQPPKPKAKPAPRKRAAK